MAKNLGGLNYPANFEQGGTNGTDPNTARDNLGVSTETLEKNANYTTNLADRGLVIRFVGAGGYTLGLAPVATLIDGWNVVVRNDSSTNLLIEPDGSEVIDGASNLILEVGQAIIIYSDDIEFFTLGQPAAPSGTGANTSLSNLSSVAINTSLVSDTDVTDDLGTLAIRWRDIFAQSLSTGDTTSDSLKIRGYDVDGATFVDFITITAGNTPTCVLHGTVTCTTQAPLTNDNTIASTAYVDSAVTAAAGAPATATYLLQTANGSLPNAQAMGALSTGLVKNTTTTGIQTIAIAGTDYLAPAAIGVTVQGYDAGLAALAAFNTNGFVVQTANNVFAGRTATGTANEIDIANPDGVSGNPVWSLPNALTFTGKTVTGGTLSGVTATTFTFTSGSIGTTVTCVTQTPLTNNTTLASTAYVDAAVAAGGGSGDAVKKTTTQASHGFIVSDVVYHAGGVWAKARADLPATCDVVGIVSAVAGVNDFTVTTHGYISGLSGLTADTTYFLSPTTAGLLTATEPTTAGYVSKPVLQAITTTTAFVINYRGVVIGDITVGPVMLSTQTVSSVVNVDFTSGLNSTYTKYRIEMTNVVPGTDNVNLLLRGSTNGGSSYLSTNEYYAGMSSINSGATAANTTNNAGTAITLNGSNTLDNASGSSSCEVTLTLSNLSSSAFYKHMMWQTAQSVSSTSVANTTGSGMIATTSPVNAIRLLASSGNISGTFTLWGIK